MASSSSLTRSAKADCNWTTANPLHPRPQLAVVERLGHVIVRPGFEALDDVLLAAREVSKMI